jgi:hypothetical protein
LALGIASQARQPRVELIVGQEFERRDGPMSETIR